MPTISVKIPRPHPGQLRVLGERSRYNVLSNGRRWGKTELAAYLMAQTALRGQRAAYHAPTYKMLEEPWEKVKTLLLPATHKKDEVNRRIELITGGILDFWSVENPDASRGRPYHRAILDEAAFNPTDKLKYLWLNVARPSLTDYKGDMWAFSTPRGRNHYFHQLWLRGQVGQPEWASWQMPTSTNPYIDALEIEAARNELDPLVFDQEYLAMFVDTNNRPFAYSFSHERHVKECSDNHGLPIWLSFDFNVDPMTCLIGQFELGQYAYFFDEIRLRDSNIYEVCSTIRARYPGRLYIVTGDASGNQRDGRTRENASYWRVIKQELELSQGQTKVPTVNPHVDQTRVLLNSLLHHHPDVRFHPTKCAHTINDLKYCEVDNTGSIDKTKDKHQTHLLDCLRYFTYTFMNKYLKLV